MAALVWFTLGIAVWHFTVFLPDRFRGGIIGAFVGAIAGAMASGAAWQIIQGEGLGTTDALTAVAAVPGCLLAMAAVYVLGVLDEDDEDSSPV